MKQTLNVALVLILISSLMVVSCKKNDPTPANSFKYNNKESIIGTALVGQHGQISKGLYEYYIYFLENTINVHFVDSHIESVSGLGDILNITMLSSDSAGIKPGDYDFSSSQTDINPFTFGIDASALLINADFIYDNQPTALYFSGGKITVVKNGDTYEFTFSINTSANTTITGFYKGPVARYLK